RPTGRLAFPGETDPNFGARGNRCGRGPSLKISFFTSF
ncbi:MAG: hypothetical protein RIQ56_438, partial [Candidatus Parcubacteria bacterium]